MAGSWLAVEDWRWGADLNGEWRISSGELDGARGTGKERRSRRRAEYTLRKTGKNRQAVCRPSPCYAVRRRTKNKLAAASSNAVAGSGT